MQIKNKKDLKSEFKKRVYIFVLRLIRFIGRLSRSSVNEIMGKQLVRSGTSVLANYVEANSASSRKDYINFFTHSLKSANESKVWISLFRDLSVDGKCNEEIEWLLKEICEIANILASSILTLKSKN
ncbi:MAG: four helix bundle protein [bacterium]|nr:four helix bundle protein [bacterium]